MVPWEQQLEHNILERGMLRRGEAMVVAVSGGLDSMVLLHLLAGFAPRHGWKLTVAHFNHRLRGRSSDADERLVRKMAEHLDLPTVVDSGDVRKFASEGKLSIEMAARELRHQFLARIARERKIGCIVLAHHADDQVELFFLRLLRGAGTEGLSGMKEVSLSPADPKIRLIRPLLHETRAALERFAKAQKIKYREDASNLSLDFQRNRIRRELLPLLKQYQPALTSTVLRSVELLAAEADFVGENAAKFLEGTGSGFEHLHVAVQRRVLLLQLRRLGFSTDFALVEKLRFHPGTPIVPSPWTQVLRDASGTVHVRKIEPEAPEVREMEIVTSQSGEVLFGDIRLHWMIEKCRGTRRGPEQNCEFFDAKKVGTKVVLRTWRPGDRFQPIGMASPIKLQDLFTNAKVPAAERRRRVVAINEAGLVFWVQGLRISETFKLDSHTQHRLKWCWNHSEPAVAGGNAP